VPQIRLGTFLSVAFPLAALVIGAENAQAIGVLYTQGYKPPINAMTIFSGVGGMVAGLFGAQNANIAGPMTAICSSDEAGENKEGRYVASVVNGITFASFGIVASIALAFVKSLPSVLISVLAGLAMINVLNSALHGAFGTQKFKVGAFFALIVAMSGITILKIGAPFWALVIGTIISLLVEPQDFKHHQVEK
jgi:benzoate membrane transport protein